MRVLEFAQAQAEPIALFESVGARSLSLADGAGAAHVYCLRFEPGGEIGPHPAGFAQLFLVVSGSAWAAGADGARTPLRTGQGAYFARGELHAKGSDEGATVIMIQVSELQLSAPPLKQ